MFCLTSVNPGSIGLKIDGTVSQEKSSAKTLGLNLSFILEHIIACLAKNGSVCSMNVIFPLNLFKSTLRPSIE